MEGENPRVQGGGGGEEAEGREEALDGKRSKGHGGAGVKNGVRSPSLRGSLRHVASSWHRVLVAPRSVPCAIGHCGTDRRENVPPDLGVE